MADTCSTCRFWLRDAASTDPNDTQWGCGACRRDPPVIVQPVAASFMPKPEYGQIVDPELSVVDLYVASKHPSTWANDWCGRHERPLAEIPL